MLAIKSTATITMDPLATCDIRINVGGDYTIKALRVECDGALQFSGHVLFLPDGCATVTQIGAPAVVRQEYTTVVSTVDFQIAPFILTNRGDGEIRFRVYNPAAAAPRNFQIWFLV